MTGGLGPAVRIESCRFTDAAKQAIGATLATDRERDVRHRKHLLLAARGGHLAARASTLTIAERQPCGDGTAPQAVRDLRRRSLRSGRLAVLVQLTPFVAAAARDLRWDRHLSLKGADAAHVASALDRRRAGFLTSAEGTKRPEVAAAVPVLAPLGLRLVRPGDAAALPGASRQGNLPGAPPPAALPPTTQRP